MDMAPATRSWTRDEVLALPDDGARYELFDGELLVSPSPRLLHQRAVILLHQRIDPYVRTHRLGWTGLAPADLDLHAGQLAQPDLFVAGLVDGRDPLDWSECGVPLLVAEVLSPSTARYDRLTKRRAFQRAGVPNYWIVDIDARLVEVWTPDADRPGIRDAGLEWRPEASLPPLEIELSRYFREVWAE
ncbi:MAG: Uma2 family endonuclease [Gemmatimonadales bacterium]